MSEVYCKVSVTDFNVTRRRSSRSPHDHPIQAPFRTVFPHRSMHPAAIAPVAASPSQNSSNAVPGSAESSHDSEHKQSAARVTGAAMTGVEQKVAPAQSSRAPAPAEVKRDARPDDECDVHLYWNQDLLLPILDFMGPERVNVAIYRGKGGANDELLGDFNVSLAHVMDASRAAATELDRGGCSAVSRGSCQPVHVVTAVVDRYLRHYVRYLLDRSRQPQFRSRSSR